MAEFEITLGSELKLAGELVGHIHWLRPYLEPEFQGLYFTGEAGGCDCDAFGNGLCNDREEKDEENEDLEKEVKKLEKMLNEGLRREAELNAEVAQLKAATELSVAEQRMVSP